MKANDLLEMIGEAKDAIIRDAKTGRNGRMVRVPFWARRAFAIAVCFVLVIGIGSFILPRLGGNSAPGIGSGNGGHDDGSVFMSYAGPIFPMTLLKENDGISSERNITMDFAPWIPEEESLLTSESILVTDSYTLTNHDATDQKISILYPFAANLNSLEKKRPILSLDGETLDTKLHAGSYSGGFQGAWENWPETRENPGSMNLHEIESWEDYQRLLSDGTYLQRALGDYPDLSHIPVTVYEFTDEWGPAEDDGAGIPNPSIRVTFEMNYDHTRLLSFGFHSGFFDKEKGICGQGFSIRGETEKDYGTPRYLIFVGEDIQNLKYQGFATGGWDTEKTVDAGVTITRSKVNLEEVLRLAAEYQYQGLIGEASHSDQEPGYDFELYYGLMKEHLIAYGVLSENGAERYESGMIEELDVAAAARVFWLEAEITIPAGESRILDAAFQKAPSFDFYCAGTENQGIRGYDLVTSLGSNLNLTKQTVLLEDRGQIEIVRQNFGFDLKKGVNKVVLVPDEPHYYLEVKRLESKE